MERHSTAARAEPGRPQPGSEQWAAARRLFGCPRRGRSCRRRTRPRRTRRSPSRPSRAGRAGCRRKATMALEWSECWRSGDSVRRAGLARAEGDRGALARSTVKDRAAPGILRRGRDPPQFGRRERGGFPCTLTGGARPFSGGPRRSLAHLLGGPTLAPRSRDFSVGCRWRRSPEMFFGLLLFLAFRPASLWPGVPRPAAVPRETVHGRRGGATVLVVATPAASASGEVALDWCGRKIQADCPAGF